MTTMLTKAVAIPSNVRLKSLGKLVKKSPTALAKQLPAYRKRSKKIECELAGHPHLFHKLSDIVIPFGEAAQLAARSGFCAVLAEHEPDLRASGPYPFARAHDHRTPVVVILGHYDHGKTTLLDALMGNSPDASLVSTEPEGITQEIRARRVDLGHVGGASGHVGGGATPHVATFIDTPGQDIFYRLRTNGALGADLALLVVDAAEGVCHQTEESIGCAEELAIPVVVALNKVDLVDDSRIDMLVSELREYVALEHAPIQPISAHRRWNLDELRRECIVSLAGGSGGGGHGGDEGGGEGDLRADKPRRDASFVSQGGLAPVLSGHGLVLDFRTSRMHGKYFQVLLRYGVLREGDHFVCGLTHGRVRALRDEAGERTSKIVPGDAVKVACVFKSKFSSSPVGEPFLLMTAGEAERLQDARMAVIDLEQARMVMDDEERYEHDEYDEYDGSDLARNAVGEWADDLRLCVIKTDSANALATVLDALADHPDVEVVLARVGNVNKTDLEYAAASGASVYCFETQDEPGVRELAQQKAIEIYRYSTLQGLIDACAPQGMPFR